MRSPEVISHYEKADYVSRDWYNRDAVLREAVDYLTGSRMMEIGNAERLNRLKNELLNKDWFMTFPDFEAYSKIREQAYKDYADRKAWEKKCLINISKAGYFSSDRTIEEYNRDIWQGPFGAVCESRADPEGSFWAEPATRDLGAAAMHRDRQPCPCAG